LRGRGSQNPKVFNLRAEFFNGTRRKEQTLYQPAGQVRFFWLFEPPCIFDIPFTSLRKGTDRKCTVELRVDINSRLVWYYVCAGAGV